MKTKRCSRCKQYKPLYEFSTQSKNRDRLSYYCKECKSEIHREDYNKHARSRLAQHREWRQSNRSKWLDITRNENYRDQYGIDLPISVDLLFDLQDARCLYCLAPIYDGNLHLDHIVPASLSDSVGCDCHDVTNFALTCTACNLSKNRYLLESWLEWRFPFQMDEILMRVQIHQSILMTEYKMEAA